MWQHHWHPHGACSFLVIRHQIPDRDLHEVHRLSVPKDAIQRDEVSVWQGMLSTGPYAGNLLRQLAAIATAFLITIMIQKIPK